MEPETLAAPDGLPELLSAEGAQARGSTARTRAANALVVALTRAARSFLLYDSGNEAIHSFLAALNISLSLTSCSITCCLVSSSFFINAAPR